MNTYTIQYMSCGSIWFPIFGTLQISACSTQSPSVLAARRPPSVLGLENLSSPGNPYISLIETVQNSIQEVYRFHTKSLGTGCKQVISTLANSQNNCICRMKWAMLRSQHPSLCVSGSLNQAQLYSGYADWMLITSWAALGSLQECVICLHFLHMETRQHSQSALSCNQSHLMPFSLSQDILSVLQMLVHYGTDLPQVLHPVGQPYLCVSDTTRHFKCQQISVFRQLNQVLKHLL